MALRVDHSRRLPASRRRVLAGLLAGAIAAPASMTGACAAAPILVAAAADLQVVMPDLVAAFRAAGGADVNVSFGATGNIARQIHQGAPFELFLAADESFVIALAHAGVIADEGRPYARGRLALAVNRRSAFAADVSLEALAIAARRGDAFRLAIANPEHAPYGQRAMEVLATQNLRDLLQPRLIYGENVAQALQYVASGAAQAGLVGSSLTRTAPVSAVVVARQLPEAWHTPLVQRLALTKRATDGARQFAAFLLSEMGQALFAAHGFARVA
jgi:molybdate transport system substrate-binding protein